MSSEYIALLTLTVGLLGTIIASTWKFSSLASKLLTAVTELKEKAKEHDAQIKLLNDIPTIRRDVDQTRDTASKCLSLLPKLEQRIVVIETQQKHSKEWRREVFRSRPEREDDEE